jgi:3-oxoacyl-[acyl-carrier protein] reductase
MRGPYIDTAEGEGEMAKLDGKIALVSGAGRGIGQAIATKLAEEGARLVINDLDIEPAEETCRVVRRAGSEALPVIGSVTDPAFGDRFVQAALDEYGQIDIIVNNAGYTWDSVVQKMTDEQWYAMIDVHLTAPFRILRAAAPYLRDAAKAELASGDRVTRKVVNISSIAGLGGNAGQSGYASGKAGIIGLTKTLAKEWGRYNVTVNSLAFGVIKTRLTEAVAGGDSTISIEDREIKVGINAQLMAAMEGGIALGRAGTPRDAANGVYLLCLPESDYITGEVLVCSGGMAL